MNAKLDARLKVNFKQTPLWVTGMFRSGTSITTKVVSHLGGNLGPHDHLLQARGPRASLNPQGFFENYLLMDLTIYIFMQLQSWGDSPPPEESVRGFNLNSIDHEHFYKTSIESIRDDRIKNATKRDVLNNYTVQTLDRYFQIEFGDQPVVKNPHFCLLAPIFDSYWPKGKYLVVFRHPADTVRSAAKVTPRASFGLYHEYYQRMQNHPDAVFFSYDRLVQAPEDSINSLAETLSLNCSISQQKLGEFIEYRETKRSLVTIPKSVLDIFGWMNENSINSKR